MRTPLNTGHNRLVGFRLTRLVFFLLGGFFMFVSIVFSQENMGPGQRNFLWTLRTKAVDAYKKQSRIPGEIVEELRKYYDTAASEDLAEFNLNFYLDRDVADSNLREQLKKTYQALLEKNSQSFEDALAGLSKLGSPSPSSAQGESPSSNEAGRPRPQATPQGPEKVVVPEAVQKAPKNRVSLNPLIEGFDKNPCEKLGVTAARRKCMEENQKFRGSRIVLDPGHLGGLFDAKDPRTFLQDGRRTDGGYQEGYGALATALIVKWCLENCFGAQSQNILLSRWDLNSVGVPGAKLSDGSNLGKQLQKGEVENERSPMMAFRSEYIKSLQPNLFISLHTNAAGVKGSQAQRVEVFTLRNPTIKHDKAYEKSLESYQNSVALAEFMIAGFRESYEKDEKTDSLKRNRKNDLKIKGDLVTQVKQTDWRVFQGMLQSPMPEVKKTPMILVEGFFHDTDLESELVATQRDKSGKSPTVSFGDQTLSFHRAHQWYAEAVSAGIARYYGCADGQVSPKSEAPQKNH